MPRRRVLESVVERTLVRAVREAGGEAFKLDPTARAGIPDRLCVFPGNRFFFVELKTKGGRLEPIQRLFHERAASRWGIEVVVLWNTTDVRNWVDEVAGRGMLEP